MPELQKPEPLKDYNHLTPHRVVWGDMDSMRHVNNTRYFYYCETARLDFIHALSLQLGSGDVNTLHPSIALAETGCRFKVSLTFPDEILIGSGIQGIEETQFVVKHLIYSNKHTCVAAEATARMVMFDFKAGKRVPIPDDLIQLLNQHAV
ncbi:MAG: acyl-CoA thioesterase [Gammaproteobacteria bacterium]|nr:acyl-CoA thioesterase [Gammaproteobacteria bacterium]